MELSQIKGLKGKRIEKLNSVGIYSPEDLILHFPKTYVEIGKAPDFNKINDGDEVAFIGKICSKPVRCFVKKGLNFIKAKVSVSGAQVSCTWFNQPFLYNSLILDTDYVIFGRLKKYKNSFEISSPQIKPFVDEEKKIVPVYKPIKGLPQNVFYEAIKTILDSVKIGGIFNGYITEKYGLIPLNEAVRILHFPNDMKDVEKASYSAALENLCSIISQYSVLKNINNGVKTCLYHSDKIQKVYDLSSELPFELTPDQKNAINEIITGMNLPQKMNKLLQGDVGSGKTIIAFLAMYYSSLNGYQSALMAPTEILARQHYKNAISLFKNTGVQVEFLSSSLSKTARDTALFNIKNGAASIVIGTHSLISNDVEFLNLSLVITDEQQRFGVSQRGAFENKTIGADSLVMSATPIPRTLALSFYGELDQIIIKTMPQSKAKISTHFVREEKRNDMFSYIKKCAENDLQTYIVCPRIEDESDGEIESVKELYNNFSPFLGKDICGFLHGKINDSEKNKMMQQFADGKIKILFATTIIEVGIDVKNAVNIVIFNAERYGLSQLHQLRGRIGRGNKDSYCFVLSDCKDEKISKRLEYFISCSDGFSLAEYDLSLRGAGDFLGERQHGGLGFNNLVSVEMIKKAKEISDYLINIPSFVNDIMAKSEDSAGDYLYNLTIN